MTPAASTGVRLVLGLALIALLCSLGFWQLDRARQKRELRALFLERYAQAPLDLDADAALSAATQAWRAAHGPGRYTGPTLLLDNRTREGRVGYEVLTGFTLADGRRLLVDRGWVPAGSTRADIPALSLPTEPRRVRGRLAPPPSTGLDFGDQDAPEQLGADLWRVQRIDFSRLEALGWPGFLPVLMYLDDTEPDGYDRGWLLPTPDDGKHTAYAVQWFAMAGAVVILCLLHLRRRPRAAAGPGT